jgi:hypothetical protein
MTFLLQITNLKGFICYLKDLFVTNVKLICNLKNLKDLYVTKVKLKGFIDAFCLKITIECNRTK